MNNKILSEKNITVGKHTIIMDGVEFGENVIIGDYTTVYSGVRIEDNSTIGSYCIIGHPTKMETHGSDFSRTNTKVEDLIINEPITIIGENSNIRSHSIIYKHVIIGKNFNSGHRAFIREHSTIGMNCVVGTNAIIGGYTKIGDYSKIQTSAFVAQSVRIGKGVFIAPYTSFYDNKKIILGDYGLQGAIVGDFVRIGGSSIIFPQIKIGNYALIGAGSVVTKDIPENAIAYGNPARIKGYQKQEEIQEYVNSILGWK